MPGFALGVISNDKILFQRTYGVQSADADQPLNSRSDFHMASISKPFAGTAIMQLVSSGKLNIDSTVSCYLPYFSMKDKRYRQITLRHILTHSFGIPDVKGL
ncbi:MAG TPA: serine hydrolase domain-containing protein [Chitinophagaceae bacterium]|nr:serine hydrolase domain-containing protein [Chitinophagaceae bacterium]